MSRIKFKRNNGEVVELVAIVTPMDPSRGDGNDVEPVSENWNTLTGRELDRAVDLMPADRVVTFTVVVSGDADQVARVAEFVRDDGLLHNAFGEHQLGGADLNVERVTYRIQ
jgi:hypothetical protein